MWGVNLRKCKACWECVAACPKTSNRQSWGSYGISISYSEIPITASGCQKCIKICPHGVFYINKIMETTNKKAFSRRKFVSVGLFLSLAILVITGVLIQIY